MQTNLSDAAVEVSMGQAVPDKAAASSDMDDFIYLISHDVRASVRALIELPQWIREDLEEAGVRMTGQVGEAIELMDRHTGRLDRMLVDLLAFSRVGRMQVTRPLDIAEALDDVLDQTRLPAGFTVQRDLGCADVIMGDRDLPTLLDALISNAVKHHDRDTGRILISSARKAGQVVISVADDGPGIAEKFQDRVFSPMTTLRPRDEVEGSGMGLANTHKIAGIYGGSARLGVSPFGRGACVNVSIPSDRRT